MSLRPSGTICTPDELAISYSSGSPTTLHCLTRGQTIGLLLSILSSFVSLISVGYVFSVVLRNAHVLYSKSMGRLPGSGLFRQPMDLWILSLLFADALQAIGSVLNIKWLNEGKVYVGTYCNAQGFVRNVGSMSVEVTNVAICIFVLVTLSKDFKSMRRTLAMIICTWLFVAIISTIGYTTHHYPPYMSPTPNWCWISKEYPSWRITEYMWFWIALVLSPIAYIRLFVYARGTLSGDQRSRTRLILAYPMAYLLRVLPISICRWISFSQNIDYNTNHALEAATFVAVVLFNLSGWIDVVLLLTMRKNSMFQPLP